MTDTKYPIYQRLGNSGLYHATETVEHFQVTHFEAVITAEFLQNVYPLAVKRDGDVITLNGRTLVIIGMDADPPTEYYAKEADVVEPEEFERLKRLGSADFPSV